MSIIQKKLQLWKKYTEMTDLGEIARRYFVMNFFDGVLTVLGVIIAFFVLFLDGKTISSSEILISGISVSVAIGISGITGGYLAEKAERKKNVIEIRRSMVYAKLKTIKKLKRTQLNEADYYPKVSEESIKPPIINGQPLEKTEVDPRPLTIESGNNSQPDGMNSSKDYYKNTHAKKKSDDEFSEETINEKAQKFATNFASLINGLAPAAGGLVGIIPFGFSTVPNIATYISAFIVITITLFLLGYYLARISKGNFWKYGSMMVLAGVITSIISLLLGA